jgi:thioredoxin-like negative regulator of GroEL
MRLLYFTQPNCLPCKRMFPRIQHVAAGMGINLELIDCTKHPDKAGAYQVQHAPTLLLVTDRPRVIALHDMPSKELIRTRIEAVRDAL